MFDFNIYLRIKCPCTNNLNLKNIISSPGKYFVYLKVFSSKHVKNLPLSHIKS